MSQIKGPAIFLAQFMGDEAPYNSLPNISAWVKSLGYKGIQLPSWDGRIMDVKKAAESKAYCDELKGQTNGLTVTELASHLQGQLVASHPAYDEMFDAFAAPEVRGNPKARAEWATQQMKYVIKASANMGLTVSRRGGIQGTGQALDANFELRGRKRCGYRVRASSGRGSLRWRDV
jgi:sugar phosphate isomerase/epimerase